MTGQHIIVRDAKFEGVLEPNDLDDKLTNESS